MNQKNSKKAVFFSVSVFQNFSVFLGLPSSFGQKIYFHLLFESY